MSCGPQLYLLQTFFCPFCVRDNHGTVGVSGQPQDHGVEVPLFRSLNVALLHVHLLFDTKLHDIPDACLLRYCV
jgi:hypothetical protein